MRSRSTTFPEARGFILPSAIFLLVMLASLAAFMLHVSAGSQATSLIDLQGARAYQAARTGAEFGLYRVIRQGTGCPSANPADAHVIATPPAFPGFTLRWQCAATTFTEEGGATARTLFHITSTASFGQPGSNDYVERQIRVTAGR